MPCNVKKFRPCGERLPQTVGNIVPTLTKIICYLTVAIINKYFKFQIDWLRMLCIRYNCMQFCSMLLCLKKKSNFEQQQYFLSVKNQNLISTNLCKGATEYKISFNSAH